jgi:hypothetical protein
MRRVAVVAAFALCLTGGLRLLAADEALVSPGVPHPGTDQILWVPTLVQAEAMARETGKPIFLMGYVASWDGW